MAEVLTFLLNCCHDFALSVSCCSACSVFCCCLIALTLRFLLFFCACVSKAEKTQCTKKASQINRQPRLINAKTMKWQRPQVHRWRASTHLHLECTSTHTCWFCSQILRNSVASRGYYIIGPLLRYRLSRRSHSVSR